MRCAANLSPPGDDGGEFSDWFAWLLTDPAIRKSPLHTAKAYRQDVTVIAISWRAMTLLPWLTWACTPSRRMRYAQGVRDIRRSDITRTRDCPADAMRFQTLRTANVPAAEHTS
jgi:hypothetical protein